MEILTLEEYLKSVECDLHTIANEYGLSNDIIKQISDESIELQIEKNAEDIGLEKNLIINDITIKPANIVFNLKKSLGLLLGTIASGIISYETLNSTKIILLCLINLGAYSTIKLDDKMISIVNILHQNNAYNIAISKDEVIRLIKCNKLYEKIFGESDLSLEIENCIFNLRELKIIDTVGDKIVLQEKVKYIKKLRY